MTEVDRLRQHADVLFDMDAHGRLARLNEPGDEPLPSTMPRSLAAERSRRFATGFALIGCARSRRPRRAVASAIPLTEIERLRQILGTPSTAGHKAA